MQLMLLMLAGRVSREKRNAADAHDAVLSGPF